MQTVETLAQIVGIINALQPGDWLVVDVDNTLIMPQDAIFQGNSPEKDFIDKFKKQNPPNLATNLSKWRLKRKVKLVENIWPEVLRTAREKGIYVFALTVMDTGKYGVIESMEKWRAAELQAIGLQFSSYADANVEVLLPGSRAATIYQGVMFTGHYSKPETLAAFMAKQSTKPKNLVFIDDRIEQVQAIETWCQQNSIEGTACHYLSASKTIGRIEQKCMDMQIQSFSNGNWLSDVEARALV